MDDLGTMVVSFAASVDALAAGADQATQQLNQVENAATQMAATFSSIPPYNAGESITDEQVAQAKLTLIESKVAEARASLAQLQGAADAGQAVTGIPEAQSKLILLEAEAQRAKESLAQIQTPIEEEGGGGGGFLGGLQNMAGGLMGLAQNAYMTALSIQGFAQMAMQAAQAMIAPDAQAEQTQVAFENLMHSTTAAKNELALLNQFAARTPFQTVDINSAAEKMLGFGFSAKSVIPNLTAIGDTLSDLGKTTPANLDQLVQIFGKIQAQGKITGMDIMQMGAMGIDGVSLLAKGLNMTNAQVQDLMKHGMDSKTAIAGLQAGMEKAFGGGMAKQAQTFNGQMSTIQSNANLAWVAFSGPAFKVVEQGLGQLGTLVASPAFAAFAVTLGTKVGGAFTVVGNILNTTIGIISSVISFFQQNQVAADLLAGVVGGLAIALLAMNAAAIISAITAIPGIVIGFGAWALAAGIAAIATLAAAWPFLLIGAVAALVIAGIILAIQHWGAVSSWFGWLWGLIVHDVVAAWNWTVNAIQTGLKWIGDALSSAGKWLYNMFVQPFIDGFHTIAGIFGAIGNLIHDVASGNFGAIGGDLHNLHIPGFASGVENFQGGWAIVGEQGPELLKLPQGSSVYPSSSSTPALSSMSPSSSGTTHIHNHLYLDGRELSYAMVDYLGDAFIDKIRSQNPVGGVA